MRRILEVTGLRCTNCGADYPVDVHLHACVGCLWPLEVSYLPAKGDSATIRRVLGEARRMWDFSGFLPIHDPRNIISLGEGGTPLLPVPYFSREGLSVFVKNEAANPTGSFKDRPLSVITSLAREHGVKTVVTGSSGNAGVALAAYAAAAGLRAVIIVPETAPREKLMAIKMYGAKIIMIKGTSSQAVTIAGELSAAKRWLNATTTFQNPFGVEGDKTVAYEIAASLGFKNPHYVLIPIGAGPLLAGCYRGFQDLIDWGLSKTMPRLVAVQAEGCAPIYRAFQEGTETVRAWEKPETIASGIADQLLGYETDGSLTLRLLKKTAGSVLSVSDKEIVESTMLLAEKTGIFAEPTAATSVAGLRQMVRSGTLRAGETVVCLVTGSGFKDIQKMKDYLRIEDIPVVPPSVEEVARLCADDE